MPDKEQWVPRRKPWAGGEPAPQQIQLMAQEDNLGLKPGLRREGAANTCSNRPMNETIPPRLPNPSVHYRVDRLFGKDTVRENPPAVQKFGQLAGH